MNLLKDLPKGIELVSDVLNESEQIMASSDNSTCSEKVNKVVAGEFRVDLE